MAANNVPQLEDGDGRYMIVNLVARRARDINKKRFNGGLPEAGTPDPLDIASNEYDNNMLTWEFREFELGKKDDFRSN